MLSGDYENPTGQAPRESSRRPHENIEKRPRKAAIQRSVTVLDNGARDV
jgi:hypothetical protein